MEIKKNRNMLTKSQWGPKLWQFLHACSFAFPESPTPDQTEAFRKLLEALRVLLPCPLCRDHYNTFLEENPAPATCGSELQKWLVDFHNDVNTRIGKPPLSLDQAKDMHCSEETPGSGSGANTCGPWKIICFVLIGLLALLLLILLVRWFRARASANKIDFPRLG